MRPQQPGLIVDQIQCFASVPDVVTRGQNIDRVLLQQFDQYRGSDTEAASRVLDIHYREIDAIFVLQLRQVTAQCPSAGLADDVTDKKYLHFRVVGLCAAPSVTCSSRVKPELGQDALKRHIPIVHRKPFDPLELVSKTDEARATPGPSLASACE
jgi:hypothetical protein